MMGLIDELKRDARKEVKRIKKDTQKSIKKWKRELGV